MITDARYETRGREADHLCAVFDSFYDRRISRWLRPEKAERVAEQCNESWTRHGRATLEVHRIGTYAHTGVRPAEPSPAQRRAEQLAIMHNLPLPELR